MLNPENIDSVDIDEDAKVGTDEGSVFVPVTFHVHDEATANWVVRRVLEARAYGERVRDWAAQEIARSKHEEDRLMYLFGTQLRQWTSGEIAKFRGRRRSLNLPSGQVGFRHSGARLTVIDEPAAVEWAIQHCPVAIRTIHKIVVNELQDHFEKTGEIPAEGTEIIPEHDRFVIQMGTKKKCGLEGGIK
jgi:hypothetical protein